MRPQLVQTLGLLFTAHVLIACGGAPSSASTTTEPASTTGGEAPPDSAVVETEAEPAPIVLRTTTPVPVPLPAVARDDLSDELQAVWTRVEEQVAIARPDGPEEATSATVQEWANGPFLAWLEARRDALTETRALLEAVSEESPYERGVALGLWAYAFEDLGAQIAGSPVPDEIATDQELLGIYIQSLNQASIPVGERAIELYADCQRRLAALGDDSEWLPWRAYCVQRGREVIEGYGLTPADADASAVEGE